MAWRWRVTCGTRRLRTAATAASRTRASDSNPNPNPNPNPNSYPYPYPYPTPTTTPTTPTPTPSPNQAGELLLERYRESATRLLDLKSRGVAAGVYTQATDVDLPYP